MRYQLLSFQSCSEAVVHGVERGEASGGYKGTERSRMGDFLGDFRVCPERLRQRYKGAHLSFSVRAIEGCVNNEELTGQKGWRSNGIVGSNQVRHILDGDVWRQLQKRENLVARIRKQGT